MDTCYLFSLRTAAWLSRQGNHTSDLSEAREFPHAAAIAMCLKHKDGRGLVLIPVRKEDVGQL